MRGADRLAGGDRQAPLLARQAEPRLPDMGEAWRDLYDEPPLCGADEPDGLDTMIDVTRGPARGIVLALVPALLVWAVLIVLMVTLLR